MRIWIDPAKLARLRSVGGRCQCGDSRRRMRRSHRAPSATCPTFRANRSSRPSSSADNSRRWRNSGTSYCARIPTARPYGSRTSRARTRRAGLRDLRAPQRQSVCRHRRAAVAERQCAGRGFARSASGCRSCRSSSRRESSGAFRTTAPGFVQISITQVVETLLEAVALVFLVMFLFLQKIPLHDHSDTGRPDCVDGHFRRPVRTGFFDQRPLDVRHGAGDRHRRGRCDRRRRERRTHHERGRPAAAAGDPQGDGPDLRRDHRRDRGAGVGVRAAGVLRRLGRATSTGSSPR